MIQYYRCNGQHVLIILLLEGIVDDTIRRHDRRDVLSFIISEPPISIMDIIIQQSNVMAQQTEIWTLYIVIIIIDVVCTCLRCLIRTCPTLNFNTMALQQQTMVTGNKLFVSGIYQTR